MSEERTYDFRAVERERQAALGARRDLRRARRRPAAEVLRPRDVAVSVGRSARRARQELHARRCDRAHPPHARLQRSAPDGLGRVRPAGRERRDPARDRPRDVDAREHPQHAAPDSADRDQLRLDARARDLPAGVLPLEPVVLRAPVRAGAGVQARGAGQLVSRRSDGAGERTGRAGRCWRCGAAVERRNLAQWFFKITDYVERLLAGLDRLGRLARPHPHDAAQLDRQERRRHVLVRGRERRGADRGVHHPRRHDVRRDIRRGRARTSGRREDPRAHAEVAPPHRRVRRAR